MGRGCKMHKVFISFHHDNDQDYKDYLSSIAELYEVFIDKSVEIGDINEDDSDETIRQIIRDDYLDDSTVTIVLVGTETRNRKHIDWEIFSSMYDGQKNKKSGILVIQLPSVASTYYHAGHGSDEKTLYPTQEWVSVSSDEYDRRYPFVPPRIMDSVKKNVPISIVRWGDVVNDNEIQLGFPKLKSFIDLAHRDKENCDYDFSRPRFGRNR